MEVTLNIVYKLTNLNKRSGKRFYIGCKQECNVVDVDGIPTIVSNRTGRPYYSSSQSLEFKTDLELGHKFSAEVLEVVDKKGMKVLCEAETKWIDKEGAVESDEYYNIANTVKRIDHDVVVNKFGEVLKDYASRCSSLSKRDGTARKLGFSNYGLLQKHILERHENGESMASISKRLGRERHFSKVTLKGLTSETLKSELIDNSHLGEELRKMVYEGCSFYHACELLRLNDVVGRILLGDFVNDRVHAVAHSRGKTKIEFEDLVLDETLLANDINDVYPKLGLVKKTYERYLLSAIKRRLGSNESE